MKRLFLLLTMLACAIGTGGCYSNNTVPVVGRSTVRLVQPVGTPADTKMCADGRLLIFPLGHAPDC